MKIAFIHDWITGTAGDVRVLQSLHALYPEAPIFCLFYDVEATDQLLPGVDIYASSLQKYFRMFRGYRYLIPFLPTAIESFDVSNFDCVISTGATFAKGIITAPQT